MTFEEKCNYIFNKYRTEFDTINEVYDIADYLNGLYEKGGILAVNDWFLPSATPEYKKDFKSLIINLKESELNYHLTEAVIKKNIKRLTKEFENTEKEYAKFLRSKDPKDLSDYDKNVLAKDDLIAKHMEDQSDDDFLDKLLDLNRKTNSINSDNERNYQDFLNKKHEEERREFTLESVEHPDEDKIEDLVARMVKYEYDHDPYEFKDIYSSDEEAFNEELKTLVDDDSRKYAIEWYKEQIEADNTEEDKAEAQAILDEITSLFGNTINESLEGNQDFWSNFNYKVGDTFNTSVGEAVLLDHNSKGNYILVKLPTEFVAAWNPEFSDGKLVWGQGHYFDNEADAREYFNSKF